MSTTNIASVATVIRTRFVAQFATAVPTYTIVHQNAQSTEMSPAGKYAKLLVLPADARQIAVGNSPGLFRDYGAVKVQLYGPLGEGNGDLLETADKVRDVFLALTDTGVTFRTPYAADLGEIGSHYQVNVTVPYFAQFSKAA